MTRQPKAPLAIWVALLVCGLLSAYSLTFRLRAESENRAVGLAAEIEQIQALAAAERITLQKALARLKQNGLLAVAINEDTVAGLVAAGQVNVLEPTVLEARAEYLDRVDRGLKNRFGPEASRLHVNETSAALRTPLDPALMRQTSVGLDPHLARVVREAGLEILARHANPNGVDERYVRETLAWSQSLGARYFLPSGDQVLGRREATPALLESLETLQMIYVSPEFAKIGGDAQAIAARPDRVVRLHAAQALEMDRLTLGGAVERYAKAASERNVRFLLVRPLSLASPKPLGSFADLLAAIGRQSEREGGVLKAPHPFRDPGVPRWLFVAIGLSLAPIAVFVAHAFGLGRRWQIAVGLLAALLGIACWLDTGRSLAALAAAVLLPLAAITLQPSMPRRTIVQFVGVCLISLIGGLAVAGLLNELEYFIRADQFLGVKFAHFAPVALVGAFAFARLTDWRSALGSPIMWSQSLIAVGLLAVIGFMLSRTGNDNPAGVSGLELQFRSLLEQFLVVRPRTKEMLIGHPALVVGLGMWIQCQASEAYRMRWGGWTALMLMVGSIGITSIVNTLCHLHTPLTIGLIRVGVGMVIGGLIGWGIWGVLGRRMRAQEEA